MDRAGIRFTEDKFCEIEMGEDIKLTTIINGEVTEYDVTGGGGGIERKRLYDNPDITVEMTGNTMFQETEIEGYTYLSFIVTSTDGSVEVEELCEIEPLKALSGQFVISLPANGTLYYRKVYRSSGAVKPSTSVYEVGKTTGDKNYCIIKSVDAVKIK